MAVTALLIVLTLWDGLLTGVASLIGIAYPPSALFVIAFGFVILLLLHFSVAVSRLTDQSKVLAQQLSLPQEAVLPFSSTEKLGVEEVWEALLGVFGKATRV